MADQPSPQVEAMARRVYAHMPVLIPNWEDVERPMPLTWDEALANYEHAPSRIDLCRAIATEFKGHDTALLGEAREAFGGLLEHRLFRGFLDRKTQSYLDDLLRRMRKGS